MRVMLVDDLPEAMEQFKDACADLEDIEVVGEFTDGMEAITFAQQTTVDVAILDIEMPVINGLEVGLKLKEIHPGMVLIYITGYSKYVIDTLKAKADYVVMKPYLSEDVEEALDRARLLTRRQKPNVQIRMFGRFQVFAGKVPVSFRNAKSKELLALCIDHRGSRVTMEEAIDKLWPERVYDEKVKRLYRKAVGALQETLEEYGIEDIFSNSRGGCQVTMDRVVSDLTECLADRQRNRFLLQEPYLYEYSWAEGAFELYYEED